MSGHAWLTCTDSVHPRRLSAAADDDYTFPLCVLQILQQLASLQPAVDEFGAVLQPLPRAHVGLADPACLPHIAQVILTGGHCYIVERCC
jgi:hypothetical protein